MHQAGWHSPMASQAVIAVVTEQDLILQVPVRVILPVQTKMHGLYLARCRRNWFICVLIGLERMFKLECKQIIRDQEREIYLWCGKQQSAFAFNMLSPSVDHVVPRNFSITDVVGHVPVPARGLAAAGHLGNSLHRRLPIPLGALGDSLGHLLDLPNPACCRWHPDLLFLLLPLLIPSLNRLTLTHASLCILTLSGGRSAWADWEPLRGQNILSDGDWAHRTQNMTLPTPSQLSCEDSQKFILTALCSHILRSDWNKNNNEWASCNCFDNKGRVVCLFSIFKIKHFSRNLDLRLKAWCFSKQHEDRTQEND